MQPYYFPVHCTGSIYTFHQVRCSPATDETSPCSDLNVVIDKNFDERIRCKLTSLICVEDCRAAVFFDCFPKQVCVLQCIHCVEHAPAQDLISRIYFIHEGVAIACAFYCEIWFGWTPCFTAISWIVESSRKASRATFALNSLLNVCRFLAMCLPPYFFYRLFTP